jgi:cytochrome c oxidase subunit 2
MNMRSSWILTSAAMLLLACDYTPREERSVSADELYQLCTTCHGPNLEGNPQVHAPAIAGLNQWYVEEQLKKFRSGARGTHAHDLTGMQMRPMAMSFHNEKEISTIAARVASMQPPKPAASLADGNAERGKTLFATCSACHGPQAAGNEQLKAPNIANANDWYLVAQLDKFRKGVRGADPRDTTGATMAPMARALPDDQAVKDVVAHIMTLR